LEYQHNRRQFAGTCLFCRRSSEEDSWYKESTWEPTRKEDGNCTHHFLSWWKTPDI